MTTLEAVAAPTALSRLILLALTLAPSIGSSQALALLTGSDDRQQELVTLIEDERSRNGPDSPELVGTWSALGLLYQERGQHALAIAAIEQARRVHRVNFGLYTVSEAPLLEQLILSEEALGNAEAAWNLEHTLLNLARRHNDDVRSARIFREIAEKRVDVLQRYERGEYPPQIELGCYYSRGRLWGRGGSCTAGSRGDVINGLSREIIRYYLAAAEVLFQHELYSSDELRELEQAVVERSYDRGIYRIGQASLRRLAFYEAASASPWQSQIDAYVQMADWELMHSQTRAAQEEALEMYRQVYQALDSEDAIETLDEIFSPSVPVVLPDFLPNPLATRGSADKNPYIDISFVVTKLGESDDVTILDASDGVARADKRRLVRLVRTSRYRPRMSEGEFDDSELVVRYFLDAGPVVR